MLVASVMSYSLVILWNLAHQVPLSMGFSRQEFWSGLPCRPPGNPPNPGIQSASLKSPALAGGFLTTRANHNVLENFISAETLSVGLLKRQREYKM